MKHLFSLLIALLICFSVKAQDPDPKEVAVGIIMAIKKGEDPKKLLPALALVECMGLEEYDNAIAHAKNGVDLAPRNQRNLGVYVLTNIMKAESYRKEWDGINAEKSPKTAAKLKRDAANRASEALTYLNKLEQSTFKDYLTYWTAEVLTFAGNKPNKKVSKVLDRAKVIVADYGRHILDGRYQEVNPGSSTELSYDNGEKMVVPNKVMEVIDK